MKAVIRGYEYVIDEKRKSINDIQFAAVEPQREQSELDAIKLGTDISSILRSRYFSDASGRRLAGFRSSVGRS